MSDKSDAKSRVTMLDVTAYALSEAIRSASERIKNNTEDCDISDLESIAEATRALTELSLMANDIGWADESPEGQDS